MGPAEQNAFGVTMIQKFAATKHGKCDEVHRQSVIDKSAAASHAETTEQERLKSQLPVAAPPLSPENGPTGATLGYSMFAVQNVISRVACHRAALPGSSKPSD